MYMITYCTANGENHWQAVHGEDAMQEFVSDLVKYGSDDIHVFNMEDEIV